MGTNSKAKRDARKKRRPSTRPPQQQQPVWVDYLESDTTYAFHLRWAVQHLADWAGVRDEPTDVAEDILREVLDIRRGAGTGLPGKPDADLMAIALLPIEELAEFAREVTAYGIDAMFGMDPAQNY